MLYVSLLVRCRQDAHAWDQPLLMLMSDPDLPFYQGEFGVGQAGPLSEQHMPAVQVCWCHLFAYRYLLQPW